MKFKDFKIDCVDLEYLKALHEVDSEVMYRKRAEYKKRILSILEIKKMIPVIEGVYSYVDLTLDSDLLKDEYSWRVLTYKEYVFYRKIRDGMNKRQRKYMINR